MKSADDIGAKVDSSVNELKIIHDLIEIHADFADTAAFCEQYDFPLDHCGNTIIVAAKKPPGKYCACIVGGSKRLDVNQTVKRLMRVSRLSFASAEETQNLTGMMIGGVTPFGLPAGLSIYADEKLLALDYVILGSGSRSSKFKINPAELHKVPGLNFVVGLSKDG
jgi:prolyl-tRNA editing enzyme YbaK/EbsC (Cys-tRNA(Pro) deacylase)